MATINTEFHRQYYSVRLRARAAYAICLIERLPRLAAHFPRAVNWMTSAPVFSGAMKSVAGMASERSAPAYATETFQHWFARRASINPSGPTVLLWPDPFKHRFPPDTAAAAV